MVPNRVTGEMVLDGGRQFIPARIVSLHTQSLLLASLVAHDRATEDIHTHAGKKRHNILGPTLGHLYQHLSWVQYISLDREVLTPSPYE